MLSITKNINMPFVRISLRKELSDDTKTLISKAIHQSLMQEFFIPKDDYFHVVEELDASQMKHPKEYLGVTHTDNLVYIQITAGSGRTDEQKRKLYADIAKRISTETEILINDIIIILVENGTFLNWSFGMGEIQKPSHI